MHPGAPPPLGCLLAGGERLAVPPPQKRLLRALHGREKPSDPGEAGTYPGGTRGIPRGLPGCDEPDTRFRALLPGSVPPELPHHGRVPAAPGRAAAGGTGGAWGGGRLLPCHPPPGQGRCRRAGCRRGGRVRFPGALDRAARHPAGCQAGGNLPPWFVRLFLFIYSVEEVLVQKSPFGNAAQLVTPPLRLAGAGILDVVIQHCRKDL